MALRFYFPESMAADLTPIAPSGADWAHVQGVVRQLVTIPDQSALTTSAYAPDAADHLVNGDACHRQYLSAPLAAQTITGLVRAQFQGLEANANNNLFLTLKLYTVTADGSAVTHVLLPKTRTSTLEFGAALANRTFPPTALTPATVAAGERLVIEVGAGGLPTATGGIQGHNFSLRYGGDATSRDLPLDETATLATYRPWLEFSNGLGLLDMYSVRADELELMPDGRVRMTYTFGHPPLPAAPGGSGLIWYSKESFLAELDAANDRLTAQDILFFMLAMWRRVNPDLTNPAAIVGKTITWDLQPTGITIDIASA